MLNNPIERTGKWAAVLALLAVAALGCREYPTVSSRQSLELIKQLYTACNTRNSARLEACRQKVEHLAKEGSVTPSEEKAFKRILELAGQGDWDTAQSESLQYARDQVR